MSDFRERLTDFYDLYFPITRIIELRDNGNVDEAKEMIDLFFEDLAAFMKKEFEGK